MRVLVVDDSLIERKYVQGLISRKLADSQVVCCTNGVEALAAIDDARPDLVVTDLQMPEMTGLELIERIRSVDSSIPIVLMTSLGSEEIAVQALAAGATSYVPKSRLDKHLLDTVVQVHRLSQQRSSRLNLLGGLVHQDLQFRLENDLELVSRFIEYVQEHLNARTQFTDSEKTRLGIALHESLTNAMNHGNLELDSDLRQEDEGVYYALGKQRRHEAPYSERHVHIGVRITPSSAEFTIRDEGPGYDIAAAWQKLEEVSFDRIGGRGLLLIRSFMDHVEFNSTGNEIRLTKFAGGVTPPVTAGASAQTVAVS